MIGRIILASILPTIALSIPLQARQFNSSDIYANWPSYDQLPLDPSFSDKSCMGCLGAQFYGVYMIDSMTRNYSQGADDELGALNHITPETIKAAKAEIEHGVAINLNLELDIPNPPYIPTRPAMTHAFIAFQGYQDDVISLNTQVSTQYDGLRHFPYSTDGNISTYQFYNDLISFDDIFTSRTNALGIQSAAQKGIAGRAVLIDWAGWKESRGEEYNPFTNYSIPTSDLNQVISWQGLDPNTFVHPGDFLIVRTGFMKKYAALPVHEQNILPFGDLAAIGVEASEETLEWIWKRKASVVGADNPGFEVFPNNMIIHGEMRNLHQIFLGGWGLSIVEFLDLEKLAEDCHSKNKFSFFFTIQNLNIVRGIASPPNALAIL